MRLAMGGEDRATLAKMGEDGRMDGWGLAPIAGCVARRGFCQFREGLV